jgi:thiamine pyrophosphate-dependent acetolactate synthase large subunit-like protein
MSQSSQPKSIRRLVAVVSDSDVVSAAASRALQDLAGTRTVGASVPPASYPAGDDYREVVKRGLRFLDRVVPHDEFTLVTAGSLAAVPAAIAGATGERASVLTLLVLDHPGYRGGAMSSGDLDRELAGLASSLGDSAEFQPSPYTVHVYTDPDVASCYSVERFTPRWMPDQAWAVAGDLACAFIDSVQVHRNARLRTPAKPSVIADAIADFLTVQAGSDWGLSYYTGSGVATFIDNIEQRAIRNGSPVVRGPSEHSLACSALARWRLDEAPFVIVVTSGMHDEFRGTILNHIAVRTRGFIVCSDSRPDQWHPFQGTIHRTGDSRPSLFARGFPVVYISDPSEIGSGLAEAFAAYSAGDGPVMVIAPREVLQVSAVPEDLPRPSVPETARAEAVRSDEVEQIAAVLNSAPRRLLCQVGPLADGALDLLHTLARKAGIALADSVTQPGTVSRYHRGAVVDEYLGALSMYGYSTRVYQYLYSGMTLRKPTEQSLMFIGTPVPEIDTPFSDSALAWLEPIQIISKKIDLAPFTRLSAVGDIEGVLRALLARLDVDPAVLALRRAAIASTSDSVDDVIGLLPVLPMTVNYFIRKLRAVVDGLIRQEDYRYTGVYDIGRAGLAAVNGLPRTGPGVSGWFGRGLMGDGLMSLPGVLTRREGNVLSFTGDGTAAMVPDILPALVQQVVADRSAFTGNLSVFTFINGSHSVIRSFRENLEPSAVSGQTGVLSFTPEDYQRQCGPLAIRHRRVLRFEDVPFADQLTERDTINLYSVITGHNNEGDGLGPLAATSWQRE